jgi:hypothetical protein
VRRALLVVLGVVASERAEAQAVSVTSRTVYHGYAIQLFPGTGRPRRDLNRFYQALDGGVFALGPGGDISAVLSMRYDTDFGTGFHDDTPMGAGIPAVGGRNDLDLLYVYVDWTNIVDGVLDARLGRQVHVDDLDWYSFDGLRLSLHALGTGEDRLDFEIYAGIPVRFEILFSSDPFVNDGTQVDDGGYFGGFTFGGNGQFRMFGLALSLGYRQELVFRGNDLEAFAGDVEQPLRSSKTFAMQESLLGASLAYTVAPAALDLYGHLTWNLLAGKLDQARAGIGWNPWSAFHFGAEYLRSRPRFLGDSIFGYFNIFPYDRGRFEIGLELFDMLLLEAGYYLQAFGGAPIQGADGDQSFTGPSFNHGPSGSVTFRYDFFSAGVYAEGASNASSDYAYGGNYRLAYIYADAEGFGGWIGGSARFSLTTFQNDWFEMVNDGIVDSPHTSFALDVGVRSRILDYASARVHFVKNFSSELEGGYRLYAELALHY